MKLIIMQVLWMCISVDQCCIIYHCDITW